MTSIRYVLRGKHYHRGRDRLAKLRALYWILVRRRETEICGKCGRPVGLVWWCFDQPVWDRVNGGYGGSLCIPCFDALAHERACFLEWAPLNLRHLECPRKDSP